MIQNQDDIIDYYTPQAQLTVHMEECAELIQAISKQLRVWGDAEKSCLYRDNLIEEIADVEVCIEQLKSIFNIPNDIIENIANYKIERQRERIRNNE